MKIILDVKKKTIQFAFLNHLEREIQTKPKTYWEVRQFMNDLELCVEQIKPPDPTPEKRFRIPEESTGASWEPVI